MMAATTVTLCVGGRNVPMTRDALARVSPEVLFPLADLEQPRPLALLVDAGMEDGVPAVHAHLCDCDNGLLRDLLRHDHADVHAYRLADKYGMHDLMRFIEAERVLRPCAQKRLAVDDALARFEWHDGVVRALLGDLQRRMHAQDSTQVADVVRMLGERAATLVVCEREVASDRAKGCVVVCWEKCGLPRDRCLEKDEYDPPWIGELHAYWVDACWSAQRPPVLFTVLEAYGGPHPPLARPDEPPGKALRIDPQNPSGWLDCLSSTRSNTLAASWDLRSVAELETFVRDHMFDRDRDRDKDAGEAGRCLVELMVASAGAGAAEVVYRASHPSVVYGDRARGAEHRPLELAGLAQASLTQVLYPRWTEDEEDEQHESEDETDA